MALTRRQHDVIAWSGFLGWMVLLAAAAKLQEERREQRPLVVVDDLEAADCTDVLQLCPDPTRHEHATGAEG